MSGSRNFAPVGKIQSGAIQQSKTQRSSLPCCTTLRPIARQRRLVVPLNVSRCGNARRVSSKSIAANDYTMKMDMNFDGARRSVEFMRSSDEPSRVIVTIDGRRVEAEALKISP